MEIIKEIIIDPCTTVQTENIIIPVSPEGNLFHVQVKLEEVFPCNDIIVGVLVSTYSHPYAFQTRTIYTGPPTSDCHLRDIILDDFDFIFTEYVELDDICIKVIAHYICL